MNESSLAEATATPPTTGIRAAYTGRGNIWPRKRALNNAVNSGSAAWHRWKGDEDRDDGDRNDFVLFPITLFSFFLGSHTPCVLNFRRTGTLAQAYKTTSRRWAIVVGSLVLSFSASSFQHKPLQYKKQSKSVSNTRLVCDLKRGAKGPRVHDLFNRAPTVLHPLLCNVYCVICL